MKQQLKKKSIFLSIFLCFVFLNSCTYSGSRTNMPSDKEAGEKVTDSFYEHVMEADYDGTLNMFSNNFYQATSKDEINAFFEQMEEKLGLVLSYELLSCDTEIITGTNPSSSYKLVYAVEREEYDATETFVLEDESGKIKILNYHIDSEGLL